jgi:CubicO group peptidase (beta-lactamase class C family)
MDRCEFLKLLAWLGKAAPLAGCFGSGADSGGDDNGVKYSGLITDMRREIAKEMIDNEVTGLSICLVDDQRVIWTEGFGFADAGAGVRADENTVFEIGSCSKTFTGFLVMQLVEKGLVGLDDPVTMYIPSFSLGSAGSSAPITIRSMLTHHSGIPGDLFNGAFATIIDPAFNDHLLDAIRDNSASWPVDTVWAYSNTAISLLHKVIEAASGISFAEYSKEFLQRIGMTSSSFYLNGHPAANRISRNYFRGAEVRTPQINIPATGSIRASVADMSKYLRMVIAGGEADGVKIVSPQTLATMLSRQNAHVPLDFDQSIGITWLMADVELGYAGRLCWHNGATLSSNSHMEILLDHGLAAMCISNSATAGGAVASIVRNTLKSALKAKKGKEQSYPVPLISAPAIMPQVEINALSGIYVNANGWHKVASIPGGLEIIMNAQNYISGTDTPTPARLIPRANGYFSREDSQENQMEFKTVSGRDILALSNRGATFLIGERYSPREIPGAWIVRIGQWTISNRSPIDISPLVPKEIALIGSEAELLLYDSMLVLSINLGSFVLEPLSDTVCKVRGLGRNNGNLAWIKNVAGSERMHFLDLEYAKNLT